MASFWALRSARLIFSAALDAAGNRAQSERRRRDRTISGRNRSIRSPSKKPETGALGEPEGFNNCARASPPSRYNNSLREVSSHAPGLLRQQRHHAPRPDTLLAALMLANNELGTLQPVAEVAAACRERGVPVLCDAVQAVGKIPVDASALGVDYLVLGAHKFYGPLGAAALWVRKGVELTGYLVGGSQERRRRASTENVPAIVGLGEAAAAAREEMAARGAHLAALRGRFEAGLARRLPDAIFHCQASPRLPNTSHVAFPGAEGESLLIRLDLAGFAVSTGSACSSGAVEPSKTLLAIGLSPEEALSSLRISFGLFNTSEEVDAFLDALEREVGALRRVSVFS